MIIIENNEIQTFCKETNQWEFCDGNCDNCPKQDIAVKHNVS